LREHARAYWNGPKTLYIRTMGIYIYIYVYVYTYICRIYIYNIDNRTQWRYNGDMFLLGCCTMIQHPPDMMIQNDLTMYPSFLTIADVLFRCFISPEQRSMTVKILNQYMCLRNLHHPPLFLGHVGFSARFGKQ
jgi:hypothetical protein